MADEHIGHRIAHYRNARGLTQEEFAGLVEVSLSLVRKWEQGARTPTTLSTIIRVARVLGVRDLSSLIGQPVGITPDASAHHPAVSQIRAAMAVPMTSRPVDIGTLERDLATAWDVLQSPGPWRYAHGGAMIPDLIRAAGTLARRDPSARTHRAAASVYLLVRPFTKWVGEPTLAMAAAERCRFHAASAADVGCWAAGEWNYAQALSTLGDPENSRAAAEAAIDELGDVRAGTAADVAAVGALHLIAAVGAVRTDDHKGARRRVEAATGLAAVLGQDTNHWWVAFGPTNVGIHQVALSAERGHSRAVLDSSRALQSGRAPSVERAVAHQLDLALAATRVKEWAEGAAALRQADALSPEQVDWSVTARESVRTLLHRAPRQYRPLQLARRMNLE